MKYKKYILIMLIALVFGCNKIYAATEETCYYLSNNKEAMAILTIESGKADANVEIQKIGPKIVSKNKTISNWRKNKEDDVTKLTLNAIYNGKQDAKNNGECPTYLILRSDEKYKEYKVYATNHSSEAQDFVDISNNQGYKTWYLEFRNSDPNKTKITKEQYYNNFVVDNDISDPKYIIECVDLFGDKNDAGNKEKGEPASLSYLINQVMTYVRIIVPIIVILLGTLDLAKAVVAGKADEMKKAQTTFIKRIIAGVIIFFIPLLVNLVMSLVDIIWEGLGYSACEFK